MYQHYRHGFPRLTQFHLFNEEWVQVFSNTTISKSSGTSRSECPRELHWKSTAAFYELHSHLPAREGNRNLHTEGLLHDPSAQTTVRTAIHPPLSCHRGSSCFLISCHYSQVSHQTLIRVSAQHQDPVLFFQSKD